MWRVDLADPAGIDPYGVAGFAPRHSDDIVALQRGEVDGFAGGGVHRLEIGLGAAGKIDLQAGMTKIKNTRAESIEAAAGNFGGEAALDQGRQQMMAGGDVEAGADRKVGQRGLAPGLGDGFQ